MAVKDTRDAAPAPEIFSLPVNVTAAEINRKNREYWYQQDSNPVKGEEAGGGRGQDELPPAANELAGELSTANGPVKAIPAPEMKPAP